MMSEPNPERDARPKRQVKQPAYLQDFVVQGLGPAKEHPPPSQREDPEVDDAAQASEQVSRNPSPISQLSGRSELLREERQLTRMSYGKKMMSFASILVSYLS